MKTSYGSCSGNDPYTVAPATNAFCDCCYRVHTGKDIDGELFELCAECQPKLAAFAFGGT